MELSCHCWLSRCHNGLHAVIMLTLVCLWDVNIYFLSLDCNFVHLAKWSKTLYSTKVKSKWRSSCVGKNSVPAEFLYWARRCYDVFSLHEAPYVFQYFINFVYFHFHANWTNIVMQYYQLMQCKDAVDICNYNIYFNQSAPNPKDHTLHDTGYRTTLWGACCSYSICCISLKTATGFCLTSSV